MKDIQINQLSALLSELQITMHANPKQSSIYGHSMDVAMAEDMQRILVAYGLPLETLKKHRRRIEMRGMEV